MTCDTKKRKVRVMCTDLNGVLYGAIGRGHRKFIAHALLLEIRKSGSRSRGLITHGNRSRVERLPAAE